MSSFFSFEQFLLAFWSPGPGEMMLLAVVALLLYGGNLPEVARSWGKTFAEFRRGLTGFQSEMNDVLYSEPEKIAYHDDSRYAHGYEETDSYHEEFSEGHDESSEGTGESDANTESNNTVSDASKETIVLENPIQDALEKRTDTV